MSFSLLRTNIKLTSNIQIASDKNGLLKLEAFESAINLNDSKYNLKFSEDSLYENLIPKFYDKTPVNDAFSLNYEEDNSSIFKEFFNLYDDNYIKGCKHRIDRDDENMFEYFAPIYIDNDLPKNFLIFRIDGPGNLDLTKDNFEEEIIDKMKVVESFSLTDSKLGRWLKNSFIENEEFTEITSGVDIDVRKDEFTKWIGIDYISGGYIEKSLFTNDIFDKDQDFHETDQLLTSGFEKNELIYPKILNLKFLFNDIPADKEELKLWSLSRYSGFYGDKILEKSLTFYKPLKLKENIIIDNNIFKDLSGNNICPFKKWRKNKNYIHWNNDFYWVENVNDQWKIISDIDLTGEENNLNKNILTITNDNILSFDTNFNTDQFDISNFNECDIWLIEIDDKTYRLKKDSNDNIYIHSDWSFELNNNILKRFVFETNPDWTISTNLNLVNKDNPPLSVKIYKFHFTEIKDFDNQIVDTKFAEYEYRNDFEINETEEPKLYTTDLNSKTIPKEFERYIYKDNIENIPVSSEYIATKELFKIINVKGDDENDEDLSNIWRKSPVAVKWAYKNSISSYDYPYKFNNSFFGEQFNRTTCPFIDNPERSERNLDYFYTLNSEEIYDFQSLNIMRYDNNENIDTNFEFELDRYFNIYNEEDYFKYLFKSKDQLKNENYIKSSKINLGDDVLTGSTLFRGIKFRIYEVDKIVFNVDEIAENYSILPTNEFNNYDFSIILTENNYDLETMTSSQNNLESEIIPEWKVNIEYDEDQIVVYNDILYISNTQSYTENPTDNPGLLSDFDVLDTNNDFKFWSPGLTYSNDDWIYNNNEYYIYDDSNDNIVDFWEPGFAYNIGDKVIYKDKMYMSNINNNTFNPKSKKWEKVDFEDPLWHKIEYWRNSIVYSNSTKVVFDGNLYTAINSPTTLDVPGISNKWELVYTFKGLENVIYNENDLIFMNNTLYRIISNNDNDYLDSGINVYINKKWKNILINIYINDNTIPDIKNANRDDLYKEWNNKLTAKNFIAYLNDVLEKYDFINNLTYYVIDEDNNWEKQDINNLKYLIVAEEPEEYEIILDSKKRESVHISNNIFKSNKILVDNEIKNDDQLNWYTDKTTYVRIKDSIIKENRNITFNKNVSKAKFWRFNGPYEPLFKDINVFRWDNNCKFDLNLKDFGIQKERVFSKVNRRENILKLRNNNEFKSIYPILDEFGYNFKDHNIFKSPWDSNYFVETFKN